MIGQDEGKALHALATRLTRLPRDPERYVAELDEVVREIRRIANLIAPRKPSPTFVSAGRGRIADGMIAVDRRLVRVERRRRRG